MRRRVLVVDDDELTCQVLETILDLEEFVVSTASDGQEALDRLSQDEFDVVVLDVMMPGIDGFGVCKAIKADERTAEVPVVLLTARDRASDRENGADAGCDAYLTKPFSPLTLIDTLTELGLVREES